MQQDIFQHIKESFGSLWKCRPRGESLEIITPFPTSTDMYVSVFLSQRDGGWVASDGGWLGSGIYDVELPLADSIFMRVIDTLEDDFDVRTLARKKGPDYYYKTTRDMRLIPNIVFDMANFIAMTATAACVQYKEKKESDKFSRTVSNFMVENLDRENLQFNSSFHGIKGARFGAIVKKGNHRASLINMVTVPHLREGVMRSNFSFDMIEQVPEAENMVDKKIVLVDDTNQPLDHLKYGLILDVCRAKGQQILTWKDRRRSFIDAIYA